MTYDVKALLRYVIKAGNDVAPNGFLGGPVPDHEVPDDFRALVNDLTDQGVLDETMSRPWGATMPARVRVTDYGRSLLER